MIPPHGYRSSAFGPLPQGVPPYPPLPPFPPYPPFPTPALLTDEVVRLQAKVQRLERKNAALRSRVGDLLRAGVEAKRRREKAPRDIPAWVWCSGVAAICYALVELLPW